MATGPVIAALVGLGVSLASTPMAMRLAWTWGVLDVPGPLKPHAAPVPYLGGVALAVALAAGLVADAPDALAAAVPVALAMALGLVDDVADLAVAPRLVAEAGVGLAVAWAVGAGTPAAVGATVLVTVVLINALNFVDGIDGLAAGYSLVCGAGFAVVGEEPWSVVAAAMAGACAGFLVYNRPPARVYLGDAGSYALGASAAVLVAAHVQANPTSGGVLAAAALVALPLAELGTTILRRLVRGQSMTEGDRDHLYDRMTRRGVPVTVTVLLLLGGQAVLAVGALGVASAY